MQDAWLNGGTPRFDRQGTIDRINGAAQHIRSEGGRVIFIRHCNAEAVFGSAAWQLDGKLGITESDSIIDKRACDSFIGTELLQLLQASFTTTILVSGLATELCVDTTIRAAVSLGFDVVALADAHTTGDRPHLSAERIIEHHNWVWANLAAPNGGKLTVQTVQDMIRRSSGSSPGVEASSA
jgi:nicotinamidase-related amidase